ncbi:MAG: exodeoxyribonuclease V subunit alpha [Lentisphaeria bacterium]|nr:exodeoxyribonuclease V subunit alpha [Lentisphaeria bacterium]
MTPAEEKLYTDLDVEFADLMIRLAGENASVVLKKYALDLASAVRNGAGCIPVKNEAERTELSRARPAVGRYPGDGWAFPLLLEGDRLYFQRLLKLENKLAQLLLGLAVRPVPAPPPDRVDEIFSPLPPSPALDRQKQAVRNALKHPLAIISGGPGTGKTTVASALLYQELLRTPAPRIAIAAPTGKAHVRLREALSADAAKFAIPEEFRQRIQTLPGGTIHRLLEWGKSGSARSSDAPLPYDLLLVDECSMISLELMTALLEALRPGARLIMLGDRAQLASVDSGVVFSDLCEAAGNAPAGHPLHGIESTLSYNFRARSAPGLVALADSLRRGELAPDQPILPLPAGRRKTADALAPDLEVFSDLSGLCRKGDAEALKQAFALLDKFRIICAVNGDAPYGVSGVNRIVLAALGLEEDSPGVPVMVTRNTYALDLFNGDTGLIVNGGLVRFPGRDDAIPLAALPGHDIAYAITAHKSQGSGYDRVLLLLPPARSQVVTRELIYTAVTRARKEVTIRGVRELIAEAVSRRFVKNSGLAGKLLRGSV